jgi:glycosyltransferase 2 family protein
LSKTFINILKFIIPLGLGVFLIWWVVKDLDSKDKEQIWKSFAGANYLWIFIAMIAGVFSHLSRAIRWLFMLESLGYKSKISNSFFAVAIGYLANLAFPRLGEVTRCGIMNRYEKIPLPALLGTVIAERVVDMLILMILTFITFFTQYQLLANLINKYLLFPLHDKLLSITNSIFLLIVTGSFVCVLCVALFFLLRGKLQSFFRSMSDVTKNFAEGLSTIKNVRNKWLFLFHSLFIWTMYISMMYFSTFALPETNGLSIDAMLSAFVFGTFGMIFTQGGIGAYPLILQATLILYGISEPAGFAFGWLTWSSQTVLILLLGFLAIILLPSFNKTQVEKK